MATQTEGSGPLTAPLAQAWPEGVPQEVGLAIATMTEADRAAAGDRLSAVLDYVGKRRTAKTAAERAGMSSVRLRQLAQAWRNGDANMVLGIRANAGAERPDISLNRLGDAPAAIEDAMRALVRSSPGLSSKLALKAVRAMDLRLPSDRTLARWLARVRRSEAAGRTFGERIAFDVRPLRLRAPGGDWHMGAFALDVGGRLVMGASLVDPSFPLEVAYRVAARMGGLSLPRFERAGLSAVTDLRSVTIAALPDDQPHRALAFFADVAAATGVQPIQARPGRAVSKVCGVRLGRLALETGGMPPGDDVPTMDHATASQVLAKALGAHHDAFCELIAGEGRHGGPGCGSLSRMLGKIAG